MQMETVLTTFDFSEPAGRAMRWAHELARDLHARLAVVHVHPDIYDGKSEVELGLPWPSQGQEERYLRFLEQEVRTVAHSLLNADDFDVHIVRGDPVKRVLALADQLHAGMICVGATGKKAVERVFLGSVSENLLRASHVPVLVVH